MLALGPYGPSDSHHCRGVLASTLISLQFHHSSAEYCVYLWACIHAAEISVYQTGRKPFYQVGDKPDWHWKAAITTTCWQKFRTRQH